LRSTCSATSYAADWYCSVPRSEIDVSDEATDEEPSERVSGSSARGTTTASPSTSCRALVYCRCVSRRSDGGAAS
jgi:hypothetical protein